MILKHVTNRVDDLLKAVINGTGNLVVGHVCLSPTVGPTVAQFLQKESTHKYAQGTQYLDTIMFVKSLNRLRRVVYKEPYGVTIYWYNNMPLIMHGYDKRHGNYSVQKFDIYYLKGTIDVEKLVTDAIALSHDRNMFRYTIAVHEGRNKKDERPVVDTGTPYVPVDYIGYDPKDVGRVGDKNAYSKVATSPQIDSAHNEIVSWYKNSAWYIKRGVPWKYSIMLHGKPGTGKTSFLKAVAQELDIPIHVLDIATMDNKDLRAAWKLISEDVPCMVAVEDVDRLFNKDKQLDPNRTKVTLDALLNCMSGMSEAEGVVMAMTANSTENIDEALLRPGRADKIVEVGIPDRAGRLKIINRILDGYPDDINRMVTITDGKNGSEIERMCQEVALKNLWGK